MQNNLLIYHDLIAGIVEAMDARDAYTASHSMRVSDMTEQICRIMKLEKEEAETIHIAAHLHDIGKIGVPDNILTKASALTHEEWEIMKSHPEIGCNILKKIEGFKEIAEIVRHHHEKWNGKGYPVGLSAQAIPLGSRIIAVADSIDAMLNRRVYREAMSLKQCKTEIERNIGIMYDPAVVGIVLQNWSAITDFHKNEERRCRGYNYEGYDEPQLLEPFCRLI